MDARRGGLGWSPGAAAVGHFDHHVHSRWSDGTVPLEDRAKTAGPRRHGVSDHFPWRDRLRREEDLLRYIDEASGLGLRVGVEYDLGVAPPLRPTTRESLAYVIGSVHQVFLDGERVGFDEAGAFLKGRLGPDYAQRERFAGTPLATRVLEETLRVVAEGIERERIDILGHPTMSPLAALGDPEAAFPVEWQDRLIALCVDAGVAFEINESYAVPHREFLIRARDAGATFSVGSDSHGELLDLVRTERLIVGAGLHRSRFLQGRRVRS